MHNKYSYAKAKAVWGGNEKQRSDTRTVYFASQHFHQLVPRALKNWRGGHGGSDGGSGGGSGDGG